jgi:hypothetical protein
MQRRRERAAEIGDGNGHKFAGLEFVGLRSGSNRLVQELRNITHRLVQECWSRSNDGNLTDVPVSF